MYQKRLDEILKKETLTSNQLDFEGDEDSEDESVRLTNIDMNILMNEYKMISEDT